MQGDAGHRPGARADAARLRPQHAQAALGETRGDHVVVLRIARERRQQHDRRPLAVDDHVERDLVVADHLARAATCIHNPSPDSSTQH
jgi:hypothetical protein